MLRIEDKSIIDDEMSRYATKSNKQLYLVDFEDESVSWFKDKVNGNQYESEVEARRALVIDC